MDETLKIFPELYNLSKTGKVLEWQIDIKLFKDGKEIKHKKPLPEGTIAQIITIHGQKDGKKQIVAKNILSGKNIGRSNETDVYETALVKVSDKFKKQLEKGYKTSISEIDKSEFHPLLLKDITELNKKTLSEIDWRNYVMMPKLDGERCLVKRVDGITRFFSRTLREFIVGETLEKDVSQIKELDEIMLDGELYHEKYDLQKIVSIINKRVRLKEEDKKAKDEIEYHIFDIYDGTELGFIDRQEKMRNILGKYKFERIKIIRVYDAKNDSTIISAHKKFVKDGYEGIVLREKNAKYFTDGKKRIEALKWKFEKEEDFEIVGFKKASGTHEGAIVWICKLPNSKLTFSVAPGGNVEERKKVYLEAEKDPSQFIGRKLQVYFQTKSIDGKPRHPRTKKIYPKIRD